MVVENKIMLELKAVITLLPIDGTQMLTYLRMSQIHIGPLMNFHAARLKDGLRRFIV
jgi:GxxExxY protein